MQVARHGRAYLAQNAADVTVVDPNGDTLTVESEHILAVTSGLRLHVQFASLCGLTAGQALATTTTSGRGGSNDERRPDHRP